MNGQWTPETYLILAIAFGALPIMIAIGTCYLKFSIVLGMLRSGFGTQQAPSGALIMALSVVMSFVVMQPVLEATLERAKGIKTQELAKAPLRLLLRSGVELSAPWRSFLLAHSGDREIEVFYRLTLPKEKREEGVTPEGGVRGQATLSAVLGAFVVTEIKQGFIISFALLVPFFVIDMVVSNVLVGMGLTMLSPIIVSLPLKVLLFVSADGWLLLTQSLIKGYG
jgi:flagellar biosynthesis protein FliP